MNAGQRQGAVLPAPSAPNRRRASSRPRHLPNGPHELTPEQVAENQTARVFAALSALVAERGYKQVSVGSVIARAGISRKTFYHLRSGLEPWFLALCDSTAERLLERVREGGAHGEDSVERGAGAVAALISFALEEPAGTRICFVETLAAGAAARAWRDDLIDRVAAEVAAGQQWDARLAARATVGAVVELAAQDSEDLDRDRAAALVSRMLDAPVPEGAVA